MLKTIQIPLLAAALASSTMLTSCWFGLREKSEPSQAARSVPIDVSKASQDLDKLVDSLKTIRATDSSDNVRNGYDQLKEQAKDLNQALDDIHQKSAASVSAGNDQIAKWHSESDQFTDPDLRNASIKRQNDLQHSVDALAASNSQLKSTDEPFRSEVDQALKALSFDLSPAGVTSIASASDKISRDAAPLHHALQDLADRSADMKRDLNH